jgi:hypothetical protein
MTTGRQFMTTSRHKKCATMFMNLRHGSIQLLMLILYHTHTLAPVGKVSTRKLLTLFSITLALQRPPSLRRANEMTPVCNRVYYISLLQVNELGGGRYGSKGICTNNAHTHTNSSYYRVNSL